MLLRQINQNAFRLALILVMGFILGLSGKFIYFQTARQPQSWGENRPIIVNCIGSDIKEETIVNAIKYWSGNGELVPLYIYEQYDSICKNNQQFEGMIVLRIAEVDYLDPTVLALTKTTAKMNVIVSSEIYFRKDTYNFSLLLEHELGHAFGYRHKNIPGHVMNPYYDLMGSKFW